MFLPFAAWCWSISWSCCGWMQCPFCLETRLWSCIPCRLPCWSFATSVHLELFVCALCGYAVAAWLHSSKNPVCDLLARQRIPSALHLFTTARHDPTRPDLTQQIDMAQHIYQPILGQCSQDALQSASWAASPIFKTLHSHTYMYILYICVVVNSMQYTVYTHIYVQLVHRLRSTLEDSLYVDLFPWQAETCCVTWGQAGAEGNAAKEQAENALQQTIEVRLCMLMYVVLFGFSIELA